MKIITCLVDPPSGWQYGFPKVYRGEDSFESMRRFVIAEGYPREDTLKEWFRLQITDLHEIQDTL